MMAEAKQSLETGPGSEGLMGGQEERYKCQGRGGGGHILNDEAHLDSNPQLFLLIVL